MAQKKTTIKDVAREAGVSVATVSYVMNHRTDIRISEETRKKVLQVSNLLNYTPNQAAKALVTNHKHLLGFAYEKSDSLFKKAQQMLLLETLIRFFHEKEYELLVVDAETREQYDQVDAIICYDLSVEHFRNLGDKNFVPLLAIDCFVNHDLFFQINTDYERLKRECALAFEGKEYSYLLLEPSNQARKELILHTFPNVVFYQPDQNLSSIQKKNLLVTDSIFLDLLDKSNQLYYAPSFFPEKIEKLYESLETALSRDPSDQHQIVI